MKKIGTGTFIMGALLLYAGYWLGSKTPAERQQILSKIEASAPQLFAKESSATIAPIQVSMPQPWTGYYYS